MTLMPRFKWPSALLVCCSVALIPAAYAADGPTTAAYTAAAETLRTELIHQAEASKDGPLALRLEYINLLKDDDRPLNEPELFRLLSTSGLSKEDAKKKAFVYTMVYGFRHRDAPKDLDRLVQSASVQMWDSVTIIVTHFLAPFATKSYLPLAIHGLSRSIVLSQNMKEPPQVRAHYADIASFWVDYTKATGNSDAAQQLTKVIQTEVIDPELRYNLSSQVITRYGSSALDLTKWYFTEYACTAFEVSTFADYLRKYGEPVEVKSIIQNKAKALSAAAQALTKPVPASQAQPSTTQPAPATQAAIN